MGVQVHESVRPHVRDVEAPERLHDGACRERDGDAMGDDHGSPELPIPYGNPEVSPLLLSRSAMSRFVGSWLLNASFVTNWRLGLYVSDPGVHPGDLGDCIFYFSHDPRTNC